MSKTAISRYEREADYIVRMAPMYDQRTGQFLFNILRAEVAEAARGTVFDPFNKDLSRAEVLEWLESHVIYNDEGGMIAFFIGDTILWEERKSA